MLQNQFKIQYLLAIILPLLFTFFAVQLFYAAQGSGTDNKAETEQPSLGPEYGNAVPIAINELPQKHATKGIDHIFISMALALLAGIAAFLGHYLKSGLVWAVELATTLVLSVLGAKLLGIGLTLFFIPNVVLTVLLILIVKHIFFNRELIRFRMLLTSIAGAAILTLYYRSLFLITKTPFEASNWQDKAVNALIIFIFISFGLTLADLAVAHIELRKQKLASYFNKSEAEDEDAP